MKNWKTTLTGAALAVAIAVYPMIISGHIDWKNIGLAVLVALYGYVSKDHDVTGGTITQ